MPSNKKKITSHKIKTPEPNNKVGHEKELKPNKVLPNGETLRRSIRKIKYTEKIEAAKKNQVKHDNRNRNKKSPCYIKNCKQSKSNEISLFGLPSNKVFCETWITKCNISTDKIKSSVKICGRHFEKCMFKNHEKKNRLLPNAVPTLFLNIEESKTTRLSEDMKHTYNNSPTDNTNSTEDLVNKVADESINESSSLKEINKKTEDFPCVLSLSNINDKQQTLLVESTNVINSINMTKSAKNTIEEPNGNVIDAVTLLSENTIPPQPINNINEPMLPIKSTEKSIEQTNSIDVTKLNENSSEGSMSKVTDVAFSTPLSNIKSSVIPLRTSIDGEKSILQNESTEKSIEVVNPIDVRKSNENLNEGLNSKFINVAPSTSSSNSFVVPSEETSKNCENSLSVISLQPNVNKNQQMLPIESEPPTESINLSNVFNPTENTANVVLPKSTINFTEKSNNNLATNVCSVTMSLKSNTHNNKTIKPCRETLPSVEIIPLESPTTNAKIVKRPISPASISLELPTKQRKQSSNVVYLTENPQSLSENSKPVHLIDDFCKSNSPCTLNSRRSSVVYPIKPSDFKIGLDVKILQTMTTYNNVEKIHQAYSDVELPNVCWKAVHYPNFKVTMFFDNTKKKKVVFQSCDNLVPTITIQEKKYLYSHQIQSKRELEKLLIKICRVQICNGYNDQMHTKCIGYYEVKSDGRCRYCQELIKPFSLAHCQEIKNFGKTLKLNIMNFSAKREQNPSAVKELKSLVLRHSENDIQNALEAVFGYK